MHGIWEGLGAEPAWHWVQRAQGASLYQWRDPPELVWLFCLSLPRPWVEAISSGRAARYCYCCLLFSGYLAYATYYRNRKHQDGFSLLFWGGL